MKRFHLQTTALSLLAACSFAAAEQVTFTKLAAAGDVYTFNNIVDTNMNVSVTAGGQMLQQMQQNMQQTRSGKMTVNEATPDGQIKKATFVFDEDCKTVQDGGQMGKQTVPSSLAGKTIVVTVNGPKDLNFSEQVDAEGATEITQLLRGEDSMMPDKPLKVGDTWEMTPEDLQQLVPPGADGKASGTGKLTGIREVGGRQVADVEMTMKMNGDMNGMKMDMNINGAAVIDVQSSKPLTANISGPFTATGGQPGPNGQQMDLKIDGKMAVTGKGTYKGTPVAVVNDGPARPNDDDAKPNIPPMPNTGPTGVFTDGKLTLSIPTDLADQATIKLGDNTYPVSDYQITNNEMTGHFTAGDSKFEFKAVFQGNTVEFTSGKRKSTLQKQGGKNPLDDL